MAHNSSRRARALGRRAVSGGLCMGMLYIPNDGIRAEILSAEPGNAVIGGAHQIEAGFVFQFLEGAAFEVGFDIENSRHATTAFYLDCVILQGDGLNNFIHNPGAQRRGSILNIGSLPSASFAAGLLKRVWRLDVAKLAGPVSGLFPFLLYCFTVPYSSRQYDRL